jgi:hypothetical protein
MRKQLILACLPTLAALLDLGVCIISASIPGNKHLLGIVAAALALIALAVAQWFLYGRAVINDLISRQRPEPPVAG